MLRVDSKQHIHVELLELVNHLFQLRQIKENKTIFEKI